MVEMGKKYKTRSGKYVTIFRTDVRGDHPVVGIMHDNVADVPMSWTPFGVHSTTVDESVYDLVEVPEERTLWLNIYGDGVIQQAFLTRSAADMNQYKNRIACVVIKYTEGQGL